MNCPPPSQITRFVKAEKAYIRALEQVTKVKPVRVTSDVENDYSAVMASLIRFVNSIREQHELMVGNIEEDVLGDVEENVKTNKGYMGKYVSCAVK